MAVVLEVVDRRGARDEWAMALGDDRPAPRRRRRRPIKGVFLPRLPARSALLMTMGRERAQLRLSEDDYAELHGISQRTLRRFRQGQSPLNRTLYSHLLARHPRWRRTLDLVVVEDAHRGAPAADTS